MALPTSSTQALVKLMNGNADQAGLAAVDLLIKELPAGGFDPAEMTADKNEPIAFQFIGMGGLRLEWLLKHYPQVMRMHDAQGASILEAGWRNLLAQQAKDVKQLTDYYSTGHISTVQILLKYVPDTLMDLSGGKEESPVDEWLGRVLAIKGVDHGIRVEAAKCVATLLERGANPNFVTNKGVVVASLIEDPDVLEHMIKHGLDANLKGANPGDPTQPLCHFLKMRSSLTAGVSRWIDTASESETLSFHKPGFFADRNRRRDETAFLLRRHPGWESQDDTSGTPLAWRAVMGVPALATLAEQGKMEDFSASLTGGLTRRNANGASPWVFAVGSISALKEAKSERVRRNGRWVDELLTSANISPIGRQGAGVLDGVLDVHIKVHAGRQPYWYSYPCTNLIYAGHREAMARRFAPAMLWGTQEAQVAWADKIIRFAASSIAADRETLFLKYSRGIDGILIANALLDPAFARPQLDAGLVGALAVTAFFGNLAKLCMKIARYKSKDGSDNVQNAHAVQAFSAELETTGFGTSEFAHELKRIPICAQDPAWEFLRKQVTAISNNIKLYDDSRKVTNIVDHGVAVWNALCLELGKDARPEAIRGAGAVRRRM